LVFNTDFDPFTHPGFYFMTKNATITEKKRIYILSQIALWTGGLSGSISLSPFIKLLKSLNIVILSFFDPILALLD